MAEKLNPGRQDRVRNLIRANRIVVRLQQFVLGRKFNGQVVEMSPAQVKAAGVLLNKLLPDLASIEHSGEVTTKSFAVPLVDQQQDAAQAPPKWEHRTIN